MPAFQAEDFDGACVYVSGKQVKRPNSNSVTPASEHTSPTRGLLLPLLLLRVLPLSYSLLVARNTGSRPVSTLWNSTDVIRPVLKDRGIG